MLKMIFTSILLPVVFILYRIYGVFSAFLPFTSNSHVDIGIPSIKDVSAMCTEKGINALIEFDRAFSGKVYSLGHEQVHECVYFNGFYSRIVLFSIPTKGCGSHLSLNTRGGIDLIENRIYVQMDKYALSIFDKKYSFLCEMMPNIDNDNELDSLVHANLTEIRRHPGHSTQSQSHRSVTKQPSIISPIIPFGHQKPTKKIEEPIVPSILFYGGQRQITNTNKHGLSAMGVLGEDLDKSGLSAIVPVGKTKSDGHMNTKDMGDHDHNKHSPAMSPIRAIEALSTSNLSITNISTNTLNLKPFKSHREVLMANQRTNTPDLENRTIYLEIRNGDEISSRVNDSVRVGETLKLVVHGKTTHSSDPSQFNIFVRDCFASDGSDDETRHVKLIDNSGCSVHSQVMGELMRRRVRAEGKDEIQYFFFLKAFKFPGKDEVHFFCSVEVADDMNFPEVCPTTKKRHARTLHHDRSAESLVHREETVTVEESVSMQDEDTYSFEKIKGTVPKKRMNRNILFLAVFLMMFLPLIGYVAFYSGLRSRRIAKRLNL